jgi:hypothetical protein
MSRHNLHLRATAQNPESVVHPEAVDFMVAAVGLEPTTYGL